ncbi:MAG: hypothetical protein HC880_16020 [Bacteroidia bacterium]|nr:hypothetical protein [Bacteroidia bacterium]
MLNIVTKAVTKIFGSKAERDLKQLLPYVTKVNQEWEKLASPQVSDDALRAKTEEIKQIIEHRLTDIDLQIAQLHQQVEATTDLDIDTKENLFNQIDKLEEERNKQFGRCADGSTTYRFRNN